MAVPYTFATQSGSIPLSELDDNFAACISGTVAISQGGTGQTTRQAAVNALAGTQTTAYYWRSNGVNMELSALAAADITGVLAVANGGTGLSALGTGVTTALGINVGSSGAFVANGGALGTPSTGILSSCTVDGTDAVGFRNIPINSQSAAYTAVLSDSGKAILHPSTDANARIFTIPSNSSVPYPIGTALTFINMTSQVVTISITTDTLYLAGTGTTGNRSLAQYGMASAIKLTSTTWLISGNGLT
jgi:hypothetical protein